MNCSHCSVFIIVVMVLMSIFLGSFHGTTLAVYIGDNKSFSRDAECWKKFIVIGDAFRIEFYFDRLNALAEDYELEALHNTVQAWIDYRSWMQYPYEWSNIERLIGAAHTHGLPVGVATGYHVGDSVDADYDAPVGFLYYYRAIIPDDEKWMYPNGTAAKDPYSVGASRSFTGKYVVRVIGKELGRRDFVTAMQPQNPYWQKFLTKWCIKTIDLGADMIFLDSPDMLFTFNWGGGWGDNETWEGQGLIRHLRSVFSNEELTAMGINSLDNFSLAKYLSMKYGKPKIYTTPIILRGAFTASWPPESVAFNNMTEVLQDPIFRESLIYWYLSAIKFVKNLTTTVKLHAKSMGKNVLITSNEYMAWFPHIILTPYMDVIYVETNQFLLPPRQTNQVIYKMALASGNYSKHVWIGEWILWFSNPYYPSTPPNNVANLIKIKVAEAYASGAQMLVPFGTGYPAEGWPPKRLVEGYERGEVASYYRFISQHKNIFTNTKPMSDVAILVSTPTAIWNNIPALGLTSHSSYQKEIMKWARILESMGITYDVLILGMDRIFSTDWAERLGRYKLIIAPELTHISPEDLEKIEEYLQMGGRLIVTPNFARYNQYGEPLPRILVESILSRPSVAIVKTLSDIKDLVTQMLPIRTIYIESPEGISQSLFASQNKLILHLINYRYGYNSTQDWIIPAEHINVSIKLPVTFIPGKIKLLSPDLTKPITLDYTVNAAGYITFTVPILKVWDIIVIEPKTPIINTTTEETRTTTIIGTITKTITTARTLTKTKTESQTITETHTHTITLEKPIEKTTVTETITAIKTHTTTLTTSTTIIQEAQILDWTVTILVSIIALVIGFTIGWIIKK